DMVVLRRRAAVGLPGSRPRPALPRAERRHGHGRDRERPSDDARAGVAAGADRRRVVGSGAPPRAARVELPCRAAGSAAGGGLRLRPRPRGRLCPSRPFRSGVTEYVWHGGRTALRARFRPHRGMSAGRAPSRSDAATWIATRNSRGNTMLTASGRAPDGPPYAEGQIDEEATSRATAPATGAGMASRGRS